MPGTIPGGDKAAVTNKKRYGADYYKKIGAMGGKKSRGGGFGSNKIGPDGLTGRQRASLAGKKGGSIPRDNRGFKNEETPKKALKTRGVL